MTLRLFGRRIAAHNSATREKIAETPLFTSGLLRKMDGFQTPFCGCYFPTWTESRPGKAKFKVEDIDPTLCTYIVVAFGRIVNHHLEADANERGLLERLNKLRGRNTRLKILLAVGGWNASAGISAAAESSSSRQTFSSSAVQRLREWGLDGLDVDWEYPANEQTAIFSAVLQDVRAAFDKEKRAKGRDRLSLSIAVTRVEGAGYDAHVINRTCDIVHVMTYDLHGSWSKTIGHHAPLANGPFGTPSQLNMVDIVKSWAEAGVDKKKLCIGIPFYGLGWTVDKSDATIGDNDMQPLRPSKYHGEAGHWPYYEIAEQLKCGNCKLTRNSDVLAPCVQGPDYWIGCDDPTSVASKAKWVVDNGYGGVFAWEISQDDFGNLGGGGRFPLLSSIHNVLTGKTSSPSVKLPKPETTPPAVRSQNVYVVKSGDFAYNIAVSHGITLDVLRKLNPKKGSMELLQPGDQIVIKGDVKRNSGSNVSQDNVHIVKPGEYAYSIAIQHGMALDELKLLNPGKGDFSLIHPGDKLAIKKNATSFSDGSGSAAVNGEVYVVKNGDYAYDIAIKHGITLDELKKLNPGKGTMELIHPGDKLKVRSNVAHGHHVSGEPAGGSESTYVVKNGDYAYDIAVRHGMSLDELKKLNPQKGGMELIHPGDKLKIRGSGNSSEGDSRGSAGSTYTVQPGDFAYNIAVKHGLTLEDLRKLNPNRGGMELLHPGDKLVVQTSDHVTQTSNLDSADTYAVKPGDFAYNIAVSLGMTLDELRKLNPQKGSMELMQPGDMLRIRGSQPADRGGGSIGSGTDSSRVYVVKAGDYAYDIAVRHGLTLEQLGKLNPGRGTMELIHPGDKLVIGGQLTRSSPTTSPNSRDLYIVKPGDFAYNIAVHNGLTPDELRRLNPERGSMELLQPGDRLKIRR